jgi:thiosulfate/3-mercaptopyruvate sulfurtransferase
MSDIVVSPSWVADRIETPGVSIIDVRDAWEFEGIGHLPGAMNVPFDSFRSEDSGEAGMLPGADMFAELLSTAGVSNDSHLIAYDDTHGVFAARLLITAELYGHPSDRLHLLEGDFSAWQREGTVSRDTPPSERTNYQAAYDVTGPLVELGTVEAALSDPDTVIVDTRELWEYEEGHIPGAVQLDWLELVDQDSRGLYPEADIQAVLNARGITPEKRILLYCNTARRISHTYIVLRYLGFDNLAFYEGSLTEWEAQGGELDTD